MTPLYILFCFCFFLFYSRLIDSSHLLFFTESCNEALMFGHRRQRYHHANDINLQSDLFMCANTCISWDRRLILARREIARLYGSCATAPVDVPPSLNGDTCELKSPRTASMKHSHSLIIVPHGVVSTLTIKWDDYAS
ncbi:hypothetical protein H4582DRAFT_393047 [Lactarius indigo]|nr:hypothetical protein H4582DRAFT_393047 [Lactarius indigo]